MIIVLAAGVGAIWYIAQWEFVSGDLRNNLWGPAHLLVRGQSPYHTRVLRPMDNIPWLPAVWLPMAIGLFFPMGWLTQDQASALWFIGSIALLIGTIWLATGSRRPQPILFALGTLAVFKLPPVLSHLRLGQFAILATLTPLLAARLVANPRHLLAGFLAGVSLTKPQLSVPVVPGLCMAYGRFHRLRGAVSFVGALTLWIVLLTLPLWIAYPRWIEDFSAALRQNYEWAHPSLITLLKMHWETPAVLTWGVSAVAIFSVNAWLWLKLRPREAVIWSLALTPLVTPYIWSWDFVLLIPLMIHALFQLKSNRPRSVLGLGYVLTWSLMVWIRYNTDNNDFRFWWMPWSIIAFVSAGYLVDATTLARFGAVRRSQ